jgi:hypothetical protein
MQMGRGQAMRDRSEERPARRGLLGVAGAAIGLAAMPAAGFRADGTTGGLPPQRESEAEKRAPRYRETDHVRAFYRTNRY